MSSSALEEQVDAFLRHLRGVRRLSDNTVVAYGRDLALLVEHSALDAPDRITSSDIQAIMARLHRNGASPKTVARWLSASRSFFDYLRHEGIVAVNPCQRLKAPKAGRKLPQTLDVDEMAQLLDIPAESEIAIRDKAMLELFYSCGIRLSELASVAWQEVDNDRQLVRVTGKGAKTREVPLGRVASRALAQWRDSQQAWCRQRPSHIFTSRHGKPLSVRAIELRVRHWAQRQGLWKRVYPHLLRHSFASHLLESSGNLRAVQELLGHANLTTTQVYTHLDFQHMAKVYDSAHPRAQRKSTDSKKENG